MSDDEPEEERQAIETYWPPLRAHAEAKAPYRTAGCMVCHENMDIAGVTFAGIHDLANVYNDGTRPAVVLPCGHMMCRGCFAQLGRPGPSVANPLVPDSKRTCPVCRCKLNHRACGHHINPIILPLVEGECIRCLVPEVPFAGANRPRYCWTCRADALDKMLNQLRHIEKQRYRMSDHMRVIVGESMDEGGAAAVDSALEAVSRAAEANAALQGRVSRSLGHAVSQLTYSANVGFRMTSKVTDWSHRTGLKILDRRPCCRCVYPNPYFHWVSDGDSSGPDSAGHNSNKENEPAVSAGEAGPVEEEGSEDDEDGGVFLHDEPMDDAAAKDARGDYGEAEDGEGPLRDDDEMFDEYLPDAGPAEHSDPGLSEAGADEDSMDSDEELSTIVDEGDLMDSDEDEGDAMESD